MQAPSLLVALVAASGCYVSAPPPEDAAANCEHLACAPYACSSSSGRCHQDCESDAQCVDGYACLGGACVGTECTPDDAPARCGAFPCVNGICAEDCALGPCAEGFYCRGDTHECVPRCTTRGDAACGGYVCDLGSGECEPYCFDGELECAAGYACDADDRCAPDLSAPSCREGCGAYACLPALDRCATRCVEDDDCAAGSSCTDGGCQS